MKSEHLSGLTYFNGFCEDEECHKEKEHSIDEPCNDLCSDIPRGERRGHQGLREGVALAYP